MVMYSKYLDDCIEYLISDKIKVYDKFNMLMDNWGELSPVAVYGAGEHTERIFEFTNLKEKKLIYIFDEKVGCFRDIKVTKPTYKFINECKTIIVSSMYSQDNIISELREVYGFKGNIIAFYEDCDRYPFYYYYTWLAHDDAGKENRFNKLFISKQEFSLLLKASEIVKTINSLGGDVVITVSYEKIRQVTPIVQQITKEKKARINICISDSSADLSIISNGEKCVPIDDFFELYDAVCETIKKDIRKIRMLAECFSKATMNNTYVSMDYKLFNQKHEDYLYHNLPLDDDYRDTAIIIQGPVRYEYNYTYETIMQYRRLFPGVKIVLSTWEDEKTKDEFGRFIDIDEVDIVMGVKPKKSGLCNVNMQIWSTANGIDFIKNNNPEINYVLKTRSDARIYSQDILKVLKRIVLGHTMTGNNSSSIVCSRSSIDTKYYYCDYYNYGYLSDMELFWQKKLMDDQFVNELDDFIPDAPEMLLYYRYVKERMKKYPTIDERQLYTFIPGWWLDMEWSKYSNIQRMNARTVVLARDKNPMGGEAFGELDVLKWNNWR